MLILYSELLVELPEFQCSSRIAETKRCSKKLKDIGFCFVWKVPVGVGWWNSLPGRSSVTALVADALK